MRIWISLWLVMVTMPGWAAWEPLPQPIEEVLAAKPEVLGMTVEVDLGAGKNNPRWVLDSTEHAVLFGRLERLRADRDNPRPPHPDDEIFPQIPPKDEKYQGLIVRMKTVGAEALIPLRFGRGRVMMLDGTSLVPDSGREIEFWLFGTTQNTRLRLLATQVLPIFSYDQCILLGNLPVETVPRQCLMPNNNIMLEVPERPTTASLKAVDFETCLQYGQALIDVFPRRCMAAGGRVYTEAPRLPASTEPAVKQQAGSAGPAPRAGVVQPPSALPSGEELEAILAPFQAQEGQEL